jgi:hypothetical protein
VAVMETYLLAGLLVVQFTVGVVALVAARRGW